MAIILQNPVDGPHIGELGHVREPASEHRLPNGRPCFRVTQTFDNPDFYWSQHGQPWRKHNALDMGNHNCGDRIKAMLGGSAYAGIDSAGALYVVIDHGVIDGVRVKTHYWHLDAWTPPITKGRWVRVSTGQQIGILGDTGLGAVCHVHIEYLENGVKKDPWPRLSQNQKVPDTSLGGEPMQKYRVERWEVTREEGTDAYDRIGGKAVYHFDKGQILDSDGESLDGDYRFCLISASDKYRMPVNRWHMKSLTPGGDPDTTLAFWNALRANRAPADLTELRQALATGLASVIASLEGAVAVLKGLLHRVNGD